MTLVVYGFPLSQPTQSVLLLAKAAKLDFEFKSLVLEENHQSSEFLSLNPNGLVPAIIQDNFCLTGGAAIMVHICETYKLNAWYPWGIQQKATVNQWLHWHHSHSHTITTRCLVPLLHGDIPSARDFIEHKLPKIMQTMDDTLANTEFLASNDSPTIADLLILPELHQLYFVDLFKRMVESMLIKYTNVHRWLRNMKNIDAYDEIITDEIPIRESVNFNRLSVGHKEHIPLVVYGFPLSQSTRSVLLLAKAAKLELEFKSMVLEDCKSSEFSSLNPNGLVPAIVQDNFCLTGGAAIMVHICETNKLNTWYPWGIQQKANVNMWLHWHHSHSRTITTHCLVPLLHGDIPSAHDFIEQKLPKIMQTMDDTLANTEFLASNDSPTIADLMILPELDQIYSVDPFKRMVESILIKYTNVHRWLRHMKKFFAYDEIVKDAIVNFNQLSGDHQAIESRRRAPTTTTTTITTIRKITPTPSPIRTTTPKEIHCFCAMDTNNPPLGKIEESSPIEQEFQIGNNVLAPWKSGSYVKRYPGKIQNIHNDGTYSILFNDGDSRNNCHKDELVLDKEKLEIRFSSEKPFGFRYVNNHVTLVHPRSQAANAQLPIGWCIQTINGKTQVCDHEEIRKSINRSKQENDNVVIVFSEPQERVKIIKVEQQKGNTCGPHALNNAYIALGKLSPSINMKKIDVGSFWIEEQIKKNGNPENIKIIESLILIEEKDKWELYMDGVMQRVANSDLPMALLVNIARSNNPDYLSHWITLIIEEGEMQDIKPIKIMDSLNAVDRDVISAAEGIFDAATRFYMGDLEIKTQHDGRKCTDAMEEEQEKVEDEIPMEEEQEKVEDKHSLKNDESYLLPPKAKELEVSFLSDIPFGFRYLGNMLILVYPHSQTAKAKVFEGWYIIKINGQETLGDHEEVKVMLERAKTEKNVVILFSDINLLNVPLPMCG